MNVEQSLSLRFSISRTYDSDNSSFERDKLLHIHLISIMTGLLVQRLSIFACEAVLKQLFAPKE